MTTLTKEIKNSVIKAAIAFTFKERDAQHLKSLTAFGDLVYAEAHGAVAEMVRKLPEGWVRYDRTLGVSGAGVGQYQGGLHRYLPLSKDQPQTYNQRPVILTKNQEAIIKSLVTSRDVIVEAEAELRDKLMALLATVNTYKQFREAWPLGVRFLPAEPVKTRALVVVGAADALNKLIGLPEKV